MCSWPVGRIPENTRGRVAVSVDTARECSHRPRGQPGHGGATRAVPPPVPGSPTPFPAGPDFVSAVRAVDIAVAYLVETEQYGAVQQQAARVMRAAVVEGATPPVPPGLMAVEEAEA